ncbi:hypothetical protein PHAMO_340002 [Magnetospirillum molischianum DSM 120]|uniref:Uncharacterized protein n=2 Tax=Magnetospirillum molischianum TaxID=1083 RepID=H8FUU1_MAGML|nr:hypothetical protein PHAMO_340002 [Magnetospirillum molischianum DSM 120]
MAQKLSCEALLCHAFARGFDGNELICVRETPYPDFTGDLAQLDVARPESLDLYVLTPDKRREVLIEVKQVHDRTGNAWRDRTSNGGSIPQDIAKLSRIPSAPGRTRLMMVVFTTPEAGWELSDWRDWLDKSPSMPEVSWERLDDGPGPLFKLNGGWLDIVVHKLRDDTLLPL